MSHFGEFQSVTVIYRIMNASFQKELQELINKHNIESDINMPDFILADMICRTIEAIGPSVKKTIVWHDGNLEGLALLRNYSTNPNLQQNV